MIKVSVIVPVYNVEKYLTRCLESLIQQTLKEIEIICINDGSVDNSLQILKDFAQQDDRIILIDKVNEGQSVARNLGIKLAQGEFICFVDSDDYVDKNYLELLYNSATKYKCDIACCGFKKVNGLKKSIRKKVQELKVLNNIDEKIQIEQIPKCNYIWNKIYKRENFLKTGLQFTPHRYFEDIELLIKILNSMGDMVTVPNTYYYYRKNPLSTVNSQSTRKKRDYYWATEEFKKYVEASGIYIPKNNLFEKRYVIKFCNLTLLKIYKKEFLIKIKLFGFIPFISITH